MAKSTLKQRIIQLKSEMEYEKMRSFMASYMKKYIIENLKNNINQIHTNKFIFSYANDLKNATFATCILLLSTSEVALDEFNRLIKDEKLDIEMDVRHGNFIVSWDFNNTITHPLDNIVDILNNHLLEEKELNYAKGEANKLFEFISDKTLETLKSIEESTSSVTFVISDETIEKIIRKNNKLTLKILEDISKENEVFIFINNCIEDNKIYITISWKETEE